MADSLLQERGAKAILIGTYADTPDDLKFLDRSGCTEVIRFFDNVLKLDGVNFGDWQAELQPPDDLRAVSFAAFEQEPGDESAPRAFSDALTPAPGPS